MAMRITENMKFSSSLSSLFNVQNQYNDILEKISSQKKINKPSDDPLGMVMLLDIRQTKASIDQYQRNIDRSSGWLAATESKLSSASDILLKAKELAVGQGTATVSAETRRFAAENVEQLKGEMLSLANSMFGERYLFSGSRINTSPFSATSQSAHIGAPVPASSNSFNGTVTAGGSYTAASNNTYVVKIINGGTLADATYRVSSDGGKAWGAEQTDMDTGTITLGDGLSLTFAGGTSNLAAGDMFHLDAYAAGNYQGNVADLTIDIGKDSAINYNIRGDVAFAGQNGGVDLFKVLDDLQSALTNNDQQGILAQLDKLTAAGSQISLSRSRLGNAMNRIELAKGNLQDLQQQMTDLTSQTEDADIAELATKLAMKEIALKATYAVASKIGNNTILDFIR